MATRTSGSEGGPGRQTVGDGGTASRSDPTMRCAPAATLRAASTLGTFLRASAGATCAKLDRVSRELLARAWAVGAGPGAAALSIDLDSTICETYGLAKQGASGFTHTGVRGYHPLLAIAAGTGDVLMARLRGGNANSGRSAGHFRRETIGRVRGAGATGQLTVRADSGFYAHAVVAVCRTLNARFSITIRQHRSVRRRIEAIPRRLGARSRIGSRAAPTWPRRRTSRSPLSLARCRCGSSCAACDPQLAAFVLYDYHAFITDRDGDTLTLEADHRRHAEIENAIRDLKYGVALNHLPSGRFATNGAWLAVQGMAHNLARWTARIGLGAGIVTTKTLRRRLFGLVGRLTRSARRVTLHLPTRWPWAIGWSTALARLRAIPILA